MLAKTLLTLAFAALATASNVLDLTPDNFDSVMLSGKPGMVEFFAPWCGHCKKLAPTWEELADSFAASGKQVTIGKVDGDAHKELSTKYGITGFPTIKWFDGSDGLPEDYTGGRGLEQLQEYVTERSGAKVKKAPKAPSSVKELSDTDFSKVVGLEKDAFVAFTAPWCGRMFIPDFLACRTRTDTIRPQTASPSHQPGNVSPRTSPPNPSSSPKLTPKTTANSPSNTTSKASPPSSTSPRTTAHPCSTSSDVTSSPSSTT